MAIAASSQPKPRGTYSRRRTLAVLRSAFLGHARGAGALGEDLVLQTVITLHRIWKEAATPSANIYIAARPSSRGGIQGHGFAT